MISPAKAPWTYSDEVEGFVLQKSRRKESLNENGTKVLFPFISKEGTLTAQVCIKKFEPRFSDNISNGIAVLNPSTMDTCGIQIGSAMLFQKLVSLNAKEKNHEAAFKVWPSDSIPPGKVGLSKDNLVAFEMKEDEYVTARAIEDMETPECAYLHWTNIDEYAVISNIMEENLRRVLRNRYFIQNQITVVEYFGKKMWFKILFELRTVQGQESLDAAEAENSIDTLKILSDLSLCNTQIESIPCIETRKRCKALKAYKISEETKLKVLEKKELSGLNTFEDTESISISSRIGALSRQQNELTNLVDLAIHRPQIFSKSGLRPCTGVILYGPPGTGKTMLLKSYATNPKFNTISIDCTRFTTKLDSSGEQEFLGCFNAAMKSPPTVILIDNLDAICPKKDNVLKNSVNRLDFLFSDMLDKISDHNKGGNKYVIVLSVTNAIESISPMLRRTGRLEHEIEIPIPSPQGRSEILSKELILYRHNLSPDAISSLADKAHGYVGSDIAAICKQAGRIALERHITDPNRHGKEFVVKLADLELGLKKVPPSAIRELIVQVPKVLWTDIGGNSDVKKKLKQSVEWPLKHPEAFQRLGIDAPGGVLLYGPPGCSKTLTAKALATESGLNFISIKGPELFSKYVGDSEKAIRKIFMKAKAASPSIIFIDELDALAGERTGKSNSNSNMNDRVLATLLTELDGVETRQDVIIVAATNRPDKIDKALLRPGRIDRIIHVPLPNLDSRRDILSIQFRKIPVSSDADVDWLLEKLDGYSGAEICAVCREAALAALERDMETTELQQSDFERAVSVVHPQTTSDVVAMYEEYAKTFRLQP